MVKDEVYPLGGSGYWAWRHYGPCYVPYFEVHDSVSSVLARTIRHAGICRQEWGCDEYGYDTFSLPPDWRAYIGYRVWS